MQSLAVHFCHYLLLLDSFVEKGVLEPYDVVFLLQMNPGKVCTTLGLCQFEAEGLRLVFAFRVARNGKFLGRFQF